MHSLKKCDTVYNLFYKCLHVSKVFSCVQHSNSPTYFVVSKTNKPKPFYFTEKLDIVLCVCRYTWGKLVSFSNSVVLFVFLFWLSMFFSGYEITAANSAHPQFLPPTLLLSFNYEKAVRRKAVGGRSSSSSLSVLEAFCFRDAISVRPGTFKIFLPKAGSLLGSCSSSVQHSLVIIPLLDTYGDKQTHTNTYSVL